MLVYCTLQIVILQGIFNSERKCIFIRCLTVIFIYYTACALRKSRLYMQYSEKRVIEEHLKQLFAGHLANLRDRMLNFCSFECIIHRN